LFNAYLSHAAEGIKKGKGQGRKSYQQDKGTEKSKDKIHMQRGGYLRRRIEDTIPEIYLLQALADEPGLDWMTDPGSASEVKPPARRRSAP